MENHSELYFITGEFARILGVKKHTLFHYDQISLLSPALKGENEYRYYLVWQMDVFEVIKALQKLGMPLEETKEYMRNRSPEWFTAMMDNKEAQVGEEIERLKNMEQFIRNEKQNIREALTISLDTPSLVKRRADFLLVSDVSAQDGRKVAVDMAEHVRMQEEYHEAMGTVGSIYLGEDLEQGIYDRYVKAYTRLEKKASSSKVMMRPGGNYMEMCRKEYNWSMEIPYGLISGFVRHRGLSTGQMWYEDLMVGEPAVTGYEDYIVKVTVPVKGTGG